MTFEIYHGDSLDVMSLFLPDNSVDAIVCDPPYGLSEHKPEEVADCLAAWLRGEEYKPNKRGFMGKTWDSWVPGPEIWRECFRVLKPGGHILAFAGSRTHDLMSMSLRLAGFENRDTVMWVYASGMPKSYNLKRDGVCQCGSESKTKCDMRYVRQTDVSKGVTIGSANREVLQSCLPESSVSASTVELPGDAGTGKPCVEGGPLCRTGEGLRDDSQTGSPESKTKRLCFGTHTRSGGDAWASVDKDGGSTPHQSQSERQPPGELRDIFESHEPLDVGALQRSGECPRCGKLKAEFEGWGTSLKPAFEPVLMFRKTLIGTVAENVLQHGTGAINIDGCRVAMAVGDQKGEGGPNAGLSGTKFFGAMAISGNNRDGLGRWPANLIHDGSEEVTALFPDSNGSGGSLPRVKVTGYGDGIGTGKSEYFGGERIPHDAGKGSAARFFYCAKASKRDRGEGNAHPTVKPTDLMAYLCRLVTPLGGVVLDPFMGSGSTGKAAVREGFNFIGIEREAEYVAIAEARIKAAA